jgi:membrane-bound metal-dependent hydrolase YbcI (DUF457 family)
MHRRQIALCAVWSVVLVLVLYVGGILLAWNPPGISRSLWRAMDVPLHGLIALVVTIPLWQPRQWRLACVAPAVGLAFCAAAVAVGIDLDHAVAAGSFSLFRLEHLPGRPISHSILFAAGATGMVWLVTRRPRLAWLAAIALLSHLFRDGIDGHTPLLWPFPSPLIPVPLYYALELALLWTAGAWANWTYLHQATGGAEHSR